MTAASIDKALWYLGRSSGAVALVLLTIVVAMGVVTRSGRPLPGLPRFAVSAIHRSSSLLAVTFVVLHIVTLTLDPQSQLRWIDAVLPFRSHAKPLWIGLGAASLDLMAALVISSLVRQHIGRRIWRFVHWSAYGLWPFAMLHAIGSGTDTRRPWMLGTLLACAAVVAGMGWWRTSSRFLDHSERVPGTRLPSSEARPMLTSRGSR